MRRFVLFIGMTFLCAALLLEPAYAYINRGTVHITLDTEQIELSPGSSQPIMITLDPVQDSQMPGCGMADCPDGCGNCLTSDGNCPCDGTEYETYYTEVLTSSSDPSVAEASWTDGQVILEAHRPGSCTVKLSARLREYTGSSAELMVTVTSDSTASVLWIAIGCVILLLITAVIIINTKKKRGAS